MFAGAAARTIIKGLTRTHGFEMVQLHGSRHSAVPCMVASYPQMEKHEVLRHLFDGVLHLQSHMGETVSSYQHGQNKFSFTDKADALAK